MHRSIVVSAATLALLLAASPASSEDGMQEPEDGMQAPEDPVESRVLDPGAAPLVDLAYDWVEGQASAATLELWVTRSEALGTWVTEEHAPVPFVVELDAEVRHVDPDGSALIETRFEEVSLLTPATDETTLAMLADLRTLSDVIIHEQYDAKGHIVAEQTVDPHADADDLHPARSLALSTVEGRLLRLPLEPIGPGGRWEETRVMSEESGATGTETFTKRLEAVDDGGRLRVVVTSSGEIPEQEVPAEQLGPDETAVMRGEAVAEQVGEVELTGLHPAWAGTYQTHVEVDLPLGTGVTYAQLTSVGARVVPAGWDDPDWPQLPPVDTSLLASTSDASTAQSGSKPGVIEVTLLDPGAEPRRLLRYDLRVGHAEDSVMLMRLGLRQVVDGAWSEWLGMPPSEMAVTNTVVDAYDDGSYLIEVLFTDVNVPIDPGQLTPEAAEDLEARLASLVGLRQTMHMDGRGHILEATTVLPEGADTDAMQPGQLDTMTQELIDPLPQEPVGVGAVWEVTRETSDALGFPTYGANTTTLTAMLADGRLRLEAELAMTADPGPMTIPDMDFMDAVLDRFSMVGGADKVVDLALVSPIEGFSESLSDYAFTITFDEVSETTEMEMSMEFEVALISAGDD